MQAKQFLLFSCILAATLQAQLLNPTAIPLRTSDPTPLPPADLQRLAAQSTGSRVHVVVELPAPPSAPFRASLSKSGIELQNWIAGTRYLASIDPSALSARGPVRLALDGVTICEMNPSGKISSYLSRPDSAQWANSEWQGRPAIDVAVLLFDDIDVENAANQARAHGWGLLRQSAWQHRITVRLPREEINQLAALDAVRHIQPVPPAPVEHDNIWSAQLMQADQVNTGSGAVTGKGVHVGIWDGGSVAPVVDFSGRLNFLETPYSAAHATHVAGTLAGDGTTDAALRGIAPGAILYSGNFYGDVFDKMRLAVLSSTVQISQNSWGEGISDAYDNCEMYGEYTQEEGLVDSLAHDRNLSVVFSMGNPRDSGECGLSARAGYYSAGVPASAKNAIAVAASDRDSAISTFSGFGPTRDGRLKPDITGLGVDVRSLTPTGTMVASGTSMSAPAISGMLALLIERFQTKQNTTSPKASLLKAILLNSARDVGNPGPDYVFGYGIPAAPAAIAAVDERRYLMNTIFSGDATHQITVPAGTATLRVLLAWTDPPGAPESANSLINDLDLSLTHGDSTVLPLTLDPLNPSADAAPAVNRRDNVEQIVIQNPEAGDYTAVVSAFRGDGNQQEYALTWAFEAAPTPPCTITLSDSVITVGETGANVPVVLTQANQCPPGEIENPSGWVKTSVAGPLQGSAVVKMKMGPNQTNESRATMLRLAGKDLHINQSGPCTVEKLSGAQELWRFLGVLDCYYYGSHAKLFTFDAKAGQTVSIQLESGDFDTYLELLSPNLSLVTYDDDSIGNTDSRIPGPTGMLTLTESGTYTIVATSYYLHDGTFKLKLEFGDPQGDPPAETMPAPINGCPFSDQGQLTDSSWQGGRRGHLYRTQAYTVQAFAGQRLDVAVTDPTFDSFIYLIAPTGAIANSNDDDPAGNGSRVSQTLTVGGAWRIEVTSFAPFTTGSYNLQVEGCPPVAQ